jgi:hypothetical protein
VDTAICAKPWGDLAGQIALWNFIAVQQLTNDIETDSLRGVLIAAVAVMCTSQLSCQIAQRFQLPAKRV